MRRLALSNTEVVVSGGLSAGLLRRILDTEMGVVLNLLVRKYADLCTLVGDRAFSSWEYDYFSH